MVAMRKHKIITTIILAIVGILVLIFLNPIHFLNLNFLKLKFRQVQKTQPTETSFIWRKSYVGNLGSNGSSKCNYIIGELRSFNGPREKVFEQYQKVLNQNNNIGILFMDGDKWPLDSILWDWRGDFQSVKP